MGVSSMSLLTSDVGNSCNLTGSQAAVDSILYEARGHICTLLQLLCAEVLR